MCARSGQGGSLADLGAGRAHGATANEIHCADDDAAQAVGDCQADRADGGDLPVEEPLEEVGGNQGGVDVEHIRYGREQGVEPATVGSRIEAGKARPGDGHPRVCSYVSGVPIGFSVISIDKSLILSRCRATSIVENAKLGTVSLRIDKCGA